MRKNNDGWAARGVDIALALHKESCERCGYTDFHAEFVKGVHPRAVIGLCPKCENEMEF